MCINVRYICLFNIKYNITMKFLEPKVHGYLDYTIGTLLLFIPSVFQLEPHTAQSIIFYIFGIFSIFLSLQTDYETGLYKLLPLEAHLIIDLLSGFFLAISPWIFDFSEKVFLLHVFFGTIILGMSLATKLQAESRTLNY